MSESHDSQPETTHGEAQGHDALGHAKTYLVVGALLLAFTFITVFLSYVDFNKWFGSGQNWNIIVAMIVAAFKGSLVAAIFMHLKSEKWTIYRFLLLTVFFVIGLFVLSVLAFHDHIHL
jgi:caa(3)-type oxidase subunit IV